MKISIHKGHTCGRRNRYRFTFCISDITSKNEEKVKKYLNNLNKVRKKIKISVEHKDTLKHVSTTY